MKLGLLDTVPRSYWSTDLGITESEKFIDFLMPVMTDTRFDQLFVAEGEWPASIDDYDAYLITGSPCSVNEGHLWIEKLQQFVRDCLVSQKKLVGICFGHQLIASALGGTVKRRRDGWLLGAESFDIVDAQSWMKPTQMKCEIFHCPPRLFRMTLQSHHHVSNDKSTIFTKFGMTDELGVFRKRDNMILIDMVNLALPLCGNHP